MASMLSLLDQEGDCGDLERDTSLSFLSSTATSWFNSSRLEGVSDSSLHMLYRRSKIQLGSPIRRLLGVDIFIVLILVWKQVKVIICLTIVYLIVTNKVSESFYERNSSYHEGYGAYYWLSAVFQCHTVLSLWNIKETHMFNSFYLDVVIYLDWYFV